MDFYSWLAFFGLALLATSAPGPGVLLAVSNSMAVGARRTIYSSMGNAGGLFAISALAMLGVGVLLATSPVTFLLFKMAGAAYLVYLGIRQCRVRAPQFDDLKTVTIGQVVGSRRLFFRGFSVAITNPKAILFFAAFLPPFIKQGNSFYIQFILLTGTFVLCTLIWHAFYIMLLRTLRIGYANPRRMQIFNYIAGIVFIVLGISLLMPGKTS